jgi:hypothetical protein
MCEGKEGDGWEDHRRRRALLEAGGRVKLSVYKTWVLVSFGYTSGAVENIEKGKLSREAEARKKVDSQPFPPCPYPPAPKPPPAPPWVDPGGGGPARRGGS